MEDQTSPDKHISKNQVGAMADKQNMEFMQIADDGVPKTEGAAMPDEQRKAVKDSTISCVTSEVLARRIKHQNREPLMYCHFIASKPKLAFGLVLGGHLFFIGICIILIRSGYDLVNFSLDRLPLDIRSDPDYLRTMAWSNRNSDDNNIIVQGVIDKNETERSTFSSNSITLIYEINGGNIFTQENLKQIEETELKLWSMAEYQKSFCLLAPDGNCTKPKSLLRFFDGTFGPSLYDPNYDDIEGILYKANSIPSTRALLAYHLGRNTNIENTTASTGITRTLLPFGYPLKGFASSKTTPELQSDKVDKFLKEDFMPITDDLYKNGAGKLSFIYGGGSTIGLYITSQVVKDLALSGGSLLFIMVFMFMQTGSIWITGFSLFGIIACFFETNLIYRIALDIKYFGTFHVLSVFIILGIGADDIFVFVDTWKATAYNVYPSLSHRMSHCYKKAAMAMFYTSFTTSFAFMISGASPFLGINSFGIFSSILILVNYVSVIVFLPPVVVTYHLYWERFKCCCCCARSKEQIATNQAAMASGRKHAVVRFFRGPYYRFVTHKVMRWFIIGFFAILLGASIYGAAQLEVNNEEIKFLGDHTNIGKFWNRISTAFVDTDEEEKAQVFLVWGLKRQDLKDCHKSDFKCTGKTRWDDNFNLNSNETQQALLDLCATIKGLPNADVEKLWLRRNSMTSDVEVGCFVETMDLFYQNDTLTGLGSSLSIPIDAEGADTVIDNNPLIYNKSNLPDPLTRNFEIALGFWLLRQPEASRKYNSLLGETKEPYSTTVNIPPEGVPFVYGTRLRYAAIVMNTTINRRILGYPKGLPIRDAWEEFASTQISAMPKPLQGGFQADEGIWHWLKVQKVLASSALLGIVIGICIALPILVLATHNIIVGLLATFTICCITTSVVAVMPLAGWKLGVLESLNLVLVVGLSVDYVVHLAEGYSRSHHSLRRGRVHDALEEVGISVVSGAVTTLGASFFLLLAQILFFKQFGIFMFSTIGFSIVYALGFFIPLLGIIGPENETGSFKQLLQLLQKCRRSES